MQMGRIEGTGKRAKMVPVSLQGLREDWPGQHSRDSKEYGNSLAQSSHVVSQGDPRQSDWRSQQRLTQQGGYGVTVSWIPSEQYISG